ncbi:MAG: hypothetical protein ACTSRP_02140 [Candidatus Helarchaeota archaeon]
MKETLRMINIIYYLVKKLEEKYPGKQIGESTIQYLMYIFERKMHEDYRYELYHRGIYSHLIGYYIAAANSAELITSKWDPLRGYFHHTKKESSYRLSNKDRAMLDTIVDRYGNFMIQELFVITTAMYLRTLRPNINIQSIIQGITALKPHLSSTQVKQILIKEGIQ